MDLLQWNPLFYFFFILCIISNHLTGLSIWLIKLDESKWTIEKLTNGGHLIICVPAHNYMYSNFDKEIGHFRRYEMNFFDNLNLEKANVKKSFFIDSLGQLIYFLNKLIFSKEVYPSRFKIFIWDKLFIPITYIIDFISFYKFGKNIICVIRKN